MNITALRPRFKQYLEPVAGVFVRCGITPNQCSFLALVAGIAAAALFVERLFLVGSLLLLLSALFDLVDGSIAPVPTPTPTSARSLTGLSTSTWMRWCSLASVCRESPS